jgi:putative endonuclease
MQNGGYIYIMTNKNKTVLYIGVTNNIQRRITEHSSHVNENAFTAKYNLEYCVYYEYFTDITLAIAREKQLKRWSRAKKEALIIKTNPEWKDFSVQIRKWII